MSKHYQINKHQVIRNIFIIHLIQMNEYLFTNDFIAIGFCSVTVILLKN